MDLLLSSIEYSPGLAWLAPVLLVVASAVAWTSWRTAVPALRAAARLACVISFVMILGSTLQLFGGLSPVPFELKAIEGLGRAGIAIVMYFAGDVVLCVSVSIRQARRVALSRRSKSGALDVQSNPDVPKT